VLVCLYSLWKRGSECYYVDYFFGSSKSICHPFQR
jgi:hypothetical protein